MGFDAAHAISSLSKLALRLMRNANKKEASQQMDMYFSAKRQTLAQFMEVYDPQRLHGYTAAPPSYLTPWPTSRPRTDMT